MHLVITPTYLYFDAIMISVDAKISVITIALYFFKTTYRYILLEMFKFSVKLL